MKTRSFLAFALLAQSVPALAAPPAALPSQTVRTADLDLASKVGQARLGHRIRVAVNQVCGEALSVDLVGQNKVRQCRDETRQSVQTQLNTAIAAAQRGTRLASAD